MDDLPRRLAADLDAAFPDLVRALQDDVYSGMLRLCRNRAEAEDLTQETFIRAYRALQGYEGERIRKLSTRGWIWTIALNLSRNRARDRARRPTPVELNDVPVDDPDPIDEVAWSRRLGALAKASRTAVVLRHVVGLNYPEIAAALGRPEGTVKAEVHRGMARLRQIMEAER